MIVSSYINPAKKKQWTRRVAMDTAAGQNDKEDIPCLKKCIRFPLNP